MSTAGVDANLTAGLQNVGAAIESFHLLVEQDERTNFISAKTTKKRTAEVGRIAAVTLRLTC